MMMPKNANTQWSQDKAGSCLKSARSMDTTHDFVFCFFLSLQYLEVPTFDVVLLCN